MTLRVIGGKELDLTVVSGIGRLTVLNLATGETTATDLRAGVTATVSSENSLYWYTNFDHPERPLIIHDRCEGFDEAKEPTLKDFAKAFTNLMSGNVYEPTDPPEM